jgi:hypothetical protein
VGGDRQESKGEGDEGAYLPSPERLDGSPPLRIRALVLELLVDRHPHNLFLCKESAHLSTPSATLKSTQRLVYPALLRRPKSAQQGWTRQILAARISLAGGTGDNLLPAQEHSQRQHLSLSLLPTQHHHWWARLFLDSGQNQCGQRGQGCLLWSLTRVLWERIYRLPSPTTLPSKQV